MRKALIVIAVIIIGAGGYLGWDWYDKTRNVKLEPSITLYYWTDEAGNKHFSDTPPPKGARDVYEEKGYKHIKRPLIVTIKDRAVEYYKKTKKKIFKPGKTGKK
jgi:hypothetical protein